MTMELQKALEQTGHNFEGVLKKRFACSHCGKTWVEIVGLFVINKEAQEDLYFQIGNESAECQNCKYNLKSCPSCGSNNAFEINFESDNDQNSPLSFDRIRTVSKS